MQDMFFHNLEDQIKANLMLFFDLQKILSTFKKNQIFLQFLILHQLILQFIHPNQVQIPKYFIDHFHLKNIFLFNLL